MPIPGGFHVEICDWTHGADRDALLAVREEVFIREQQVPPDLERDDNDARAVHVLARTLDGTPIGSGRITFNPGSEGGTGGRIGRMAVLRGWRGQGVGASMLHALVDVARTRRVDALMLHAQHDAIGFYRRYGFEPLGEEFAEAGIVHRVMRRKLDPPEPPPARPLPPVATAVALRARTREGVIEIIHTLLAQAKREVCLLVRELDPIVFNDTASLVEMRRIAISGRGASIRVIAQDIRRALDDGSRALDLARRLPSVFELRRPVEQTDLDYPSAFLCVDSQGYLFRPLEGEMTASASTRDPGRHAQLMRLFEDVWSRSESWPELRLLKL